MTRRSQLEVLAAILTGALHPVFVDVLHLKGLFIAAALIGWALYVALSVRRDSSLISAWGLSRQGLAGAAIASGSVSGVGLLALGAVAVAQGSFRLHWHMLPLLVLYPAWGLAQQFIVQAVFVRPLCMGPRPLVPPCMVTGLAASLFGVVHLPNVTLTAVTFLLGLGFTPIYIRWRNLWPLAIFHGWLGVACYFWLLQRDPWVEVLGSWA